MELAIPTHGHNDVVDITDQIAAAVHKTNVSNGVALVFVSGSTAALTTIEYEPGVIEDLRELLEQAIPEGKAYRHHERWGDHNGAAHLRAALIGPDLMIPIANGALQLGTWQQVVLLDFDERPRQRTVHVQVIAAAVYPHTKKRHG